MTQKPLKPYTVAKKFGVSHPTVAKWIEAALEKKNNLVLQESKGKYYIIDNFQNNNELEKLKQNAQKFKNKLSYRKIVVKARIYKIFTVSQIIEIMTKIRSHKIIPHKYCYFDKGAGLWNSFSDYLLSLEDSELERGLEIMDVSFDYLLMRLKGYDKINLVDVGPGNGFLAKIVIEKFQKHDKNITYSAIDISKDILDLLEENFSKWNINVPVNNHVIDIDENMIRDILFYNKSSSTEKSCNLVLFLGSTIGSSLDKQKTLNNFSGSFDKDDYLWINTYLKYKNEYADMDEHMQNKYIIEHSTWLLDEIGFEKEDYELVRGLNQEIDSWIISAKMIKDIDLEFHIEGNDYTVNLFSGDEITVYNYSSYTLENFMQEIKTSDFDLLNASISELKDEVILLADVKN